MNRIGACEARTHLHELLRRVAEGEAITITRHGVPVAILKPVERGPKRSSRETISDLRRFRAGRRLRGLSIRDLIDEGRG